MFANKNYGDHGPRDFEDNMDDDDFADIGQENFQDGF